MPVVSFDSSLLDRLEKLDAEYPYIWHAIVRGTWEEWPLGSDPNDTWDSARRHGFNNSEINAIAKFLVPESAYGSRAIMSGDSLTVDLNEWSGYLYDRDHHTLDQNGVKRRTVVLRSFSIIAEECTQRFAKSGHAMPSDVSISGQSARSKWLALVYKFLQPYEERVDLGDGQSAICLRHPGSIFATSLALLRKLQGTNAPSPKVRFPTPPGASWRDVRLKFVDGHTLSITLRDIKKIHLYADIGMADRRNIRPTKQWELLRTFARNHGTLTWKDASAHRRVQKRREKLAQDLKAFFRIDGDPIEYDEKIKGWRTVFSIEPDA